MSLAKTTDLFFHERQAWQRFSFVAGLDEAGRGAWAGPVVAAAAVFVPGVVIDGVNDSKILSPKKREKLFDEICARATSFAVGIVECSVIDQINILEASKVAMIQAIDKLSPRPDYLLIDGNMTLNVDIPQAAIVDGDALSFSIAAASILAKVTRDRLMVLLAQKYPLYGFERHKGYGTGEHQAALSRVGVSPQHRFSYAPVARLAKAAKNGVKHDEA